MTTKLSKVPISDSAPDETLSIAKPSAFSLDKFKTKRADAIAGVDTLPESLPHHPISHAKDFVRLHPDEAVYWSPELCFVVVPIKGQSKDQLHLIDEDIAVLFLPSGKVKRFRLALATKPFDVFFLCHLPTRNEDNGWNASALIAAEQAKTKWVQATSRKQEGVESYRVDAARDPDAFPAPKWPQQPLAELIEKAFIGRLIDREEHPALLRLLGAKQELS